MIACSLILEPFSLTDKIICSWYRKEIKYEKEKEKKITITKVENWPKQNIRGKCAVVKLQCILIFQRVGVYMGFDT